MMSDNLKNKTVACIVCNSVFVAMYEDYDECPYCLSDNTRDKKVIHIFPTYAHTPRPRN
jgi:uncharacterized CHY-type Zn-finger protein